VPGWAASQRQDVPCQTIKGAALRVAGHRASYVPDAALALGRREAAGRSGRLRAGPVSHGRRGLLSNHPKRVEWLF
jgi:hypothetical protein